MENIFNSCKACGYWSDIYCTWVYPLIGNVIAESLCFASGFDGPKDQTQALTTLLSLKEDEERSEDPIYLHVLAIHYDQGRGIAKDLPRAFSLYKRSAELGFVHAMCNLGVSYCQGHGTQQDDPKAVEWFRRGSEIGDAVCMHNLALHLFKGEGCTANVPEGNHWLQAAADLGDEDAAALVGWAYANGQRGLTPDPARAVAILQPLAEHRKHTGALLFFGLMVYTGNGVPEDLKAGRALIEEAAERGSAQAKDALARMDKRGFCSFL